MVCAGSFWSKKAAAGAEEEEGKQKDPEKEKEKEKEGEDSDCGVCEHGKIRREYPGDSARLAGSK